MPTFAPEITALLHLIDDPDQEVYALVEERILSLGEVILPDLEAFWQSQPNSEVQTRLEWIIHRIHYNGLRKEIRKWALGDNDLLYGALLVSKYQYPELETTQMFEQLEKIRRNIWLELNSYLTPLEQSRVMEKILFRYLKFDAGELNYQNPARFLIYPLLESKKGNHISLAVLYLIFAEKLDLPVRAVKIPNLILIAWFHAQTIFGTPNQQDGFREGIVFFTDPKNGIGFSHDELDRYLQRMGETPLKKFYKPLTNKQVIIEMLRQLSICFDKPDQQFKQDELLGLIDIIESTAE